MAQWNIKNIPEEAVKSDSSVHSITALLLAHRGITNIADIEKFLFPSYDRDIHDPFLFSQMERVVKRVDQARDKKEKVLIYGDYDADGVTSATILKETLKAIGIDSGVYIPHKMLEGYGLNIEAVKSFIDQGVKLILTVDCGITSREEVALANQGGIDVIVTDHHHVPQELPAAYAIINPHQKDCGYPFPDLAGVGVAFKIAQALLERLLPKKKDQLKWLLDAVAIGTVADCVPLLGENRVIAKYGMVVLSKTRRVGLQELFAVSKMRIDEDNLPSTWNISFQIAPRINAAGRMDHANTAFFLLAEENRVKARDLALEVESKNQERQKVTTQLAEEVRKIAQNMFGNKKFIYAVGEHFPLGIIGLVAGKIAQEFNRPVCILQRGENESKGSFRSIPQVNIIDMIEECQDILVKFGGHSQAAGVTLKNENIQIFFDKLEKLISEKIEGADLNPMIEIDAELMPKDVDLQLMAELQKFEPFGQGNPEPIFLIRNLKVDKVTLVGNGEKHLKMALRAQDGSPKIFEAIGFGMAKKLEDIVVGDTLEIVGNLTEDSWNGNKKIVLRLIDVKKIS